MPDARRAPAWTRVALALLLAQGALLLVLRLRPGRVARPLFEVGPWMLLGAAAVTLLVALGELVRSRRHAHPPVPPFGEAREDAAIGLVRMIALGALVLTASASLTLYRAYPSSYDFRPGVRCYRIPLEGDVSVVQGGAAPGTNHHAAFPSERWAYDLGLDRAGSTHAGGGYRVVDYYAYDAPVHAPAPGTVVTAHDGEADQSPADRRWLPYRSPGGNHVVLQVGDAEYVVLAHLRPGTITVRPGQHVAQGQVVGHVGNSGRSGAPHLHVHLQDTPEVNTGEGIPMPFCDYLAWPQGREPREATFVPRGIPRGGARREVIRAARTAAAAGR